MRGEAAALRVREDLWATEWERWRARREGSESLGGVQEATSLESRLRLSARLHPVASIRSLSPPQQLPESVLRPQVGFLDQGRDAWRAPQGAGRATTPWGLARPTWESEGSGFKSRSPWGLPAGICALFAVPLIPPSHCVSQYLRFLIMLPAGGGGWGAGVAEVRVREEPDRMRVWEWGEVEGGRG